MTIPTDLKIGPFRWTFTASKDVAFEGQCYGSTHHGSQKIFLDPDNTVQKNEQVVFHEVMHALWWQAGLGIRYDKEHKNLEEEVVSAISMGLYQVLKDNDLLK